MSGLARGLIYTAAGSRQLSRMACNPHTGTFKYFSYGSNLLRERILINNPTAHFFGLGTLHGYRLTFDTPTGLVGDSDLWLGAVATIRRAGPDNYVCGVVWEIETAQIEFLDSQEIFYTGIEVDVKVDQGDTITCRTYEMTTDTQNITLPSPQYKKVMIAGAKQNGLPEEYIRFLESRPDNGVKDTPPLYRKVIQMVKKYRQEKGNVVANGKVTGTSDLDLEDL